MHIPRFILIAFLILVVGGTALATSQLVSNSEPRLGDPVVVTPVGTPPPTTPPTTPATTPAPTASPSPSPTTAPPTAQSPTPPPPSSAPPGTGAVEVPGCAPLAGNDDDDCDDWDDDWDDFDDD